MTLRARRIWLTLGALAGVAAVAVALQFATLPDVAPLARENPATTAFITRYQARLREQGTKDRLDWRPVPLTKIAPDLALAVLVSEDIGFFSHQGFELSDLHDAMREAMQKGEAPRGASTITQQLAKNLWLSPSRNPLRKLKEALLTRQLEHRLSKERILELYLNVVEFGPGLYGAEAAAERYFGKPASDLNAHESAQLAASLPRPTTWHPGVESSAYHRQVTTVESRMARTVFLRRRFGLPVADTTRLDTDTLLTADSLWSPGDSVLARDTMP